MFLQNKWVCLFICLYPVSHASRAANIARSAVAVRQRWWTTLSWEFIAYLLWINELNEIEAFMWFNELTAHRVCYNWFWIHNSLKLYLLVNCLGLFSLSSSTYKILQYTYTHFWKNNRGVSKKRPTFTVFSTFYNCPCRPIFFFKLNNWFH